MNSEIRKMFCDLLGEDRVFTEEAMSQHTTFKIGGPADYFLMPDKDTGRCIAFGCGSCRQKCFTYRLRVCGRDSGNDRRRGCDECRGLWW